MIRDEYSEYFTRTGQIKRTLSPEDKLFIRQKLLDELDRGITIVSGTGKVVEPHLFRCAVCSWTWETALGHVCSTGSGCPRCSGKHKRTYSQYMQELRAAAPEYKIHSISAPLNQRAKITMTCPQGHTTESCIIANFLNNNARCLSCAHNPNTIYLYELGSTGVYKVGITSAHLGMRRINDVAKAHNVAPTMILLEHRDTCRDLESTILSMFSHRKAVGMVGDGATEMLELTESDISIIKEIINASK